MKNLWLIIVWIGVSWPVGSFAANPKAVDLVVTDGESGLYILYEDGWIQTAGTARNYGMPSKIQAVDFVLTSSGKGYYVLDKSGSVYSFGDASQIWSPLEKGKTYMAMVPSAETNGFYFLSQDGNIIPVGSSKFYGELLKPNAVDLKLASGGLGYYVLYQDGVIAFFGTAVNYGYTQSSSVQAVDMELASDGYYVLYKNGTVANFGHAVPLPSTEPTTSPAVDMFITNRGYRILYENGETKSFFRVDNQGAISWYAQALARVVAPLATPTPTPVVIPTLTPRPEIKYFTIRQTGFTERVIGKLANTIQIPQSLTTGQASLSLGGTFLVVSTDADQPPREILFFNKDDLTNSNNPGTVFADLVTQRGAAFIRGVSYSKVGLTIAIEDDSGFLLVLIQGNFEPTSVAGYAVQ